MAKEELLDQRNSLRLKCSTWSCVSHTRAAANTQAAAAAHRSLRLSAEPSALIPLNQAQHRLKPIPDRSALGSHNSCHQLQIHNLGELVWKGISDEHPIPRHSPAAWQTPLTVHRLPQVSPPALSPPTWKRAGVQTRPWSCGSCSSIDSCPTSRRISVCRNVPFSKRAPPQTLPLQFGATDEPQPHAEAGWPAADGSGADSPQQSRGAQQRAQAASTCCSLLMAHLTLPTGSPTHRCHRCSCKGDKTCLTSPGTARSTGSWCQRGLQPLTWG